MCLWIHWTSCQFKFLMPLEPCRSLQFCVLEVHKSDAAHSLNASLFMENVVLCCSLRKCWGWIKNRRVWSFVWCVFLVCFPKCPFLISETLRRMALMRGLSPIRLLEVNAARVCIFVLLEAIEVFGSASSLAKETILFQYYYVLHMKKNKQQ